MRLGNMKRRECRKFPFTKRVIESLPPHDPESRSHGTEYSDAECIGLRLIVGPTGRKHFLHRYTYMGRARSMALGEWPAVSHQDARQRVNENKAMLARDLDPADERNKLRAVPTFSEFALEQYLPHARQRKKTHQEDQWKIERALIPAFGNLKLNAITTNDIRTLHSREKERTSGVTANHMLRLLCRMLNLACAWGLLEKNPASGVEKFPEAKRERYLNPSELKRFVEALDQMEDTPAFAAIRLLLYAGARREEILALRWERVDFDEGTFLIPNPKNKRPDTKRMNVKTRPILEALWAQRQAEGGQSPYVFPSRAGAKKAHLYDLRKPFERVLEVAGITNFRIHDMRHTFATYAARVSNLQAVGGLLNHKDVASTQRYAHLMDDTLQKASDAAVREMEKACA